MNGIKEIPVKTYCPLYHKEETVYFYAIDTESVFLPRFNGCDDKSGDPE